MGEQNVGNPSRADGVERRPARRQRPRSVHADLDLGPVQRASDPVAEGLEEGFLGGKHGGERARGPAEAIARAQLVRVQDPAEQGLAVGVEDASDALHTHEVQAHAEDPPPHRGRTRIREGLQPHE